MAHCYEFNAYGVATDWTRESEVGLAIEDNFLGLHICHLGELQRVLSVLRTDEAQVR